MIARVGIAALLLTGVALAATVWWFADRTAKAPVGVVVVAGTAPILAGTRARAPASPSIGPPPPAASRPAPAIPPTTIHADDLVDPMRPDPTLFSDDQVWGDGWVREDGVTSLDGVPVPRPPAALHAEEG